MENGRINSTNDIEVYQMVSPKFAIRAAVGNTGFSHLLQSLQEDLVRWAGEANELIIKDTRACTIYEPIDQTAYTANGRVKLCDGFVALECLTLAGCVIPFLYKKNRCTNTCQNSCCSEIAPSINEAICNNHRAFTLEGCWVKIHGPVNDSEEVVIQGWKIPMDEDGYVKMIDGIPVTACTQYIAWQLCLRMGDNRASTFERIWYNRARQARAFINKKTDSEMREISKYWFPNRFTVGGRGGNNGNRR